MSVPIISTGKQVLTGKNVLGLILAGGSSQRLGGGDKSLRPLGDHTILHQVCARLKPQTDQIILSANSDPAFFASFGYPIINDGKWLNSGPLAGILAGCHYATQLGCSHVMSVAADTPFFPPDLLQRFAQALTDAASPMDDTIIFARSDFGAHPTFALWPANIAASLENWLSETKRRSIRVFANNHTVAYADFSETDKISGLDPFFNINTQTELALARSAWQLQDMSGWQERES
ncbi:molybdopterin-guanine dinucleotide biosynthesis protein A [Pseudochrobactrum saccharolyticum]|uniref:Molybdenum cofactor guanylyltransferase n=1 Tax=Pseudochrobactrum saccharolyticum TaxID=354352 RepID=A0A7W8EMU4_9HYPH|nr:molybdenum cofactor guanylyltransferase MobA [Pseudochrobactrum saccharolyticum]KAB0539179.1 molybdenum cofactor guanylyltransferase MobA [Pseudochrobactrum saccharolyticum]MBB5090795.1 molybdopterin-guanine dinucleotide biosynthesis protein A [Pseudochrobactrum saccharolyticum]